MINKVNKNAQRTKRHVKLRHDLSGTTLRPRLCVYRSLSHIYAQIIDDSKQVTLVACNTTQKEIAFKVIIYKILLTNVSNNNKSIKYK